MLATSYNSVELALMAVAAIAGAMVGRRTWWAAAAAVVAAQALTWSWVEEIRTAGNVLYWGLSAGYLLAALPLARRWKSLRRWLGAAAGVTAAFGLSAAWSILPHTTLTETVKFGAIAAVASVTGAHVARSRADAERLGNALALLAPLGVALTIALVLFLHEDAVAAGGSVSGFLDGPNTLGIFLALTVPFVVTRPRVTASTAAVGVVAALTSFLIVLSGSRTGFIAFALALLTIAIGRRNWRLAGGSIICATLGAAVAIAWAPGVPTLGAPLSPTPGEGSARGAANPTGPSQAQQLLPGGRPANQSVVSSMLGARDEAWREAIRLFDRRPILGNGFGTGSAVFDHYGSKKRFHYFIGAHASGQNTHDSYLQQFLELGVPGGLALLAAAAAAGWLLIQKFRRGWSSAFEAACSAGVVAALFSACFESILFGAGILTMLVWIASSSAAATAQWAAVSQRSAAPQRARPLSANA